jgi:RNA polymerase sigma-70 factor (ECF subfamily)
MISKSSRLGVGSLICGRALRGPQYDKWSSAPFFLILYNALFHQRLIYKLNEIKKVQQHNPHRAEEYILSFQQGEEKGFSFFFKEFYAALCYFSYTIIKDSAAAEDIAEDAFIKLWERHSKFENAATIKSFLYSVVRNASIDRLREKKKRIAYSKEIIHLAEEKESFILQQIIEAETYREVVASLKILPPKCRQIFRMIYFEGKDYGQIASELNLSINTIRVQKARALALLRQQFGTSLVFLASFALSQ